MNLAQFLQDKTLYYEKIDYDVIRLSWDILKEHIKLPFVIHIIGTNGKGSTGRYLASFINQNGKKVLHYSSPHILKFNERIWINGSDSSDEILEDAHKELQKILPKDYLKKLTYFEYTTLLALYLSSRLDYLVLEAGLGGEFDATNVVKNDLTVLTAIGLDHQSFLGNTVKDITLTKVRSCDNTLIVSEQTNEEVYEILDENFKDIKIIKIKEQKINSPFFKEELPLFLRSNLKSVFFVLDYLKLNSKNLELPKLKGRYEQISENIFLDVGHNPLSADVLSKQLEKENKKVILIYNSFKDKDYYEVLNILKRNIKKVLIIACEDDRIVLKSDLKKVLLNLNIRFEDFSFDKIKKNETYLVYGSFSVAETFLKGYKVEK